MIAVIRLGPRRTIDTTLDSMGRTWVGYDPERTDVELWAQNRGRYAFSERRLEEVRFAALAYRGEIKVVAAVSGWEPFEDWSRGVMKRALIGEVLGPGEPAYRALHGRVLSMAGQNSFAYFEAEELGLEECERGSGAVRMGGVVQGWKADPVRRKLVEDLAQDRLMARYREMGWAVTDTRIGNPYDAVARRNGELLFLEAKGTETHGQAVRVTRGEVEHARAHPGQCMLGVLSEIRFTADGTVDAESGVLRTLPWNPDAGELTVTGYDWRPAEE